MDSAPNSPSDEIPAEGDQKPSNSDVEDGVGDDREPQEAPPEPPTEPESTPVRKLTKKDILNRLFEKNELILDLNKQNKKLAGECKQLTDKWLRSHAEFENYRKRTHKEWELLKHHSKGEVILEMLRIIDDFNRAFSVVGDRDDDFVQGIRLIYNNMQDSLEKLGVREMEALDAPFDPNYHMAVAQLEKEGAETGHVTEVIEPGYLLDDTVLRPAKVVIAK
jgi:molecular chaperone GrpE